MPLPLSAFPPADANGTLAPASTDITLTPAATKDVIISDSRGLIVGGTSQITVSDGDGSTNLIPEVQIQGTTKTDGSMLLSVNSATATSAAAPSVNLLKSAHATIGSNTIVVSGEVLGEINFFGADGVDFESCAVSLRGIVDTTPGAGDMPGRFAVFCSADGAETPLEKMRVTGAAATASVTVGVAGTSTGTLYLSGATSNSVGLRATDAAGNIVFILPAAVGSNGEQLTTNGNAGTATLSWAAAACAREVKRDIEDVSGRAADVLDRLARTPVYSFRYRQDAERNTTGDFDTRYTGMMAEDLPEMMHFEGRIFSPVSAFGLTALAIKGLLARVESLESERRAA